MFVIMLDDLLAQNPQHWPVSAQSNDKNVLRQLTQHDGIPELQSREAFEMEPTQERKSLINAQTGKRDEGAIYDRIPRQQR